MADPSCVGRGAGAEYSEAAGLGRERAAAERAPHRQSALRWQSALRCSRLEPLTHVALRIETSVYPSCILLLRLRRLRRLHGLPPLSCCCRRRFRCRPPPRRRLEPREYSSKKRNPRSFFQRLAGHSSSRIDWPCAIRFPHIPMATDGKRSLEHDAPPAKRQRYRSWRHKEKLQNNVILI